jgi:hypothetical protein
MNNCHEEVTWLVNSKLRPANRPIRRITSLGPYLSEAQPPNIANPLLNTDFNEMIQEVAARVKWNSFSIDLKKTPNDEWIPRRMVPMVRQDTTTIQP